MQHPDHVQQPDERRRGVADPHPRQNRRLIFTEQPPEAGGIDAVVAPLMTVELADAPLPPLDLDYGDWVGSK